MSIGFWVYLVTGSIETFIATFFLCGFRAFYFDPQRERWLLVKAEHQADMERINALKRGRRLQTKAI